MLPILLRRTLTVCLPLALGAAAVWCVLGQYAPATGQRTAGASIFSAAPEEKLATYTSAFYLVHTTLTREEAREYGAHMDAVFSEYRQRFSSFKPRFDAPLELYLFRTRDQYLNYLSDHDINGVNSGGMFVYTEKARGLFTWVQGKSRSTTLETLQHEGFHQFAFACIGNLPVWVNEGLAQYFEDGVMINGRMTLGMVNAKRLAAVQAAIKDSTIIDFDALLTMSDDKWHATLVTDAKKAGLLYDQAWSVCYFLIHGDNGKYRAAFQTFLEKLSKLKPSDQDKGVKDAFAAAFGNNDTTSFRQRWIEYTRALEPDPLNIAITRMEFLGQALRWLQSQKAPMPRTIDELRAVLQKNNYKAWRSTHGIKFEFDAKNNALYEYPLDKGTAKFELIDGGNAAKGLPPSVSARGLHPQPTLVFSKDRDGQLTQDVEWK